MVRRATLKPVEKPRAVTQPRMRPFPLQTGFSGHPHSKFSSQRKSALKEPEQEFERTCATLFHAAAPIGV